MKRHAQQQGLTLIEMLVTIAILGMVLAGLYGLLDAANRAYRDNRALIERQQTSRAVLNYLLFRLREIDGSGLVKDPRYCTDCHTVDLDGDPTVDDNTIPCPKDVRIPRRSLYIEDIDTYPLITLADVPAKYQHLDGFNKITFWADLLPYGGMPDEFTDSPSSAAADATYSGDRDGVFNLTVDKNNNGEYNPEDNDREVLYYDVDDDGKYDYYAEKWSYWLEPTPDGKTFQLIESLSFTHTSDKGGVIDVSDKNTSGYDPYTAPVAYGVTGLGIKPLYRYTSANYPEPQKTSLEGNNLSSCSNGAGDRKACHGSEADESWLNIYENATAMSYERFVTTHDWWNIRALSIQLAVTETQKRKFMKMKHILIPRNLEVNIEYYSPE